MKRELFANLRKLPRSEQDKAIDEMLQVIGEIFDQRHRASRVWKGPHLACPKTIQQCLLPGQTEN